MAIPGARAAAFDGGVERHCVGAAVALGSVLECRWILGLRATDGDEGDSNGPTFPEAGTKVGVYSIGGADTVDQGRRIGGDRKLVDGLVPNVIGRHHGAVADPGLGLRRGGEQQGQK